MGGSTRLNVDGGSHDEWCQSGIADGGTHAEGSKGGTADGATHPEGFISGTKDGGTRGAWCHTSDGAHTRKSPKVVPQMVAHLEKGFKLVLRSGAQVPRGPNQVLWMVANI